jgi:sulfane dehydrogenase subunit SoxC
LKKAGTDGITNESKIHLHLSEEPMAKRDSGASDHGKPPDSPITRRDLLVGAAGALGGAVVAGLPALAAGQQSTAPVIPAPRTAPTVQPGVPNDVTKLPGAPTSAVGARAPVFKPARTPVGELAGASLTPLQDLTGTITPADLHFERHHNGVPAIDAARHSLLVHGLVEKPTVFSLDDIKRFPQVTRVYFVECAGNGRGAYRDPKPDLTPQKVAGLTSNSEWTGVAVKTLFDEAGVRRDATWFLAEGGDAAVMTRSIPVAKGLEDALVVWAQNGEPLRPEQGYPLRLLLPGWEGNANVKWLRRLELGLRPWMTRWETSKYTDPMSDGTALQFTFEMHVKSVITAPAHPQVIAKGWWPVSGLAWSGNGRVARVDVSTDSGATWHEAKLHEPVLSKAHVRFTHMWEWDGRETILMSRATDDTGAVQPTRTEIVNTRGIGTDYHFNPIYGWKVAAGGQLTFHGTT